MKQYNILHRGVPLVFTGDLLARTSSKPRNDPERDKWTDFEIFLTEENKLVVNIVNVTPNGDSGNRSFVCEGFFDVEKCLTHPVYGTMSFAAQKCYKEALEYAIECGLVDRGIYEIDPADHDRRHDKQGEHRKLPEQNPDEPIDFDFTED